jgi:hypothetical protein
MSLSSGFESRTTIFLRSGWMCSGNRTERCGTLCSGGYLRHSPLNNIPVPESRHYNDPCADGNLRHCKSDFAAWLADCAEYSDLLHLERHICFWCDCPKKELGEYVHPGKQHPQRDHNLHRTLSHANTKAAEAKLSSRHVHRATNVFRRIPCIVSDLPKPDLLHAMQIGMLQHLQKWIFHFRNTHETARPVQCNLVIRACLRQPHTKQ